MRLLALAVVVLCTSCTGWRHLSWDAAPILVVIDCDTQTTITIDSHRVVTLSSPDGSWVAKLAPEELAELDGMIANADMKRSFKQSGVWSSAYDLFCASSERWVVETRYFSRHIEVFPGDAELPVNVTALIERSQDIRARLFE